MQVFGSSKYPLPGPWTFLGNFTAQRFQQEQDFEELTHSPLVRYLRFEFLTHWEQEYYCTLSQIR